MGIIRVLVVEDDPMKLKTVVRLLAMSIRAAGHVGAIEPVAVLSAAVSNLALYGDAYGFVVSDWTFPEGEVDVKQYGAGAYVVDLAKKRGLPVVVFSGDLVPHDFEQSEFVRWATSPDIDKLREIVRFYIAHVSA